MFRALKTTVRYTRQHFSDRAGSNAKDKFGYNALSADLDKNLIRLKDLFANCSDISFRESAIGTGDESVRIAVVYVEGLINDHLLTDGILKPLMQSGESANFSSNSVKDAPNLVKERLLAIDTVTSTKQLGTLADHVLTGDAAVLLNGSNTAFLASVQGWEARGVEEPDTETVVRGPRDGFTENLRVNTAHIRRRIRTPRLKIETMKIGSLSKTDVAVLHIKGVANTEVVSEVKRRLSRIDTDSILESGYIQEFIEDQPITPFPLMNSTERPDKVAAGLLEGQVAIMVDTTPFVLLVPYTFPQFLMAAEDSYNRYPLASYVRLLRFIALNIGLLMPGIYVAVTTFHPEMIPTPLLISIAGSREGVPFPAFVEAFLMESAFELLREAGARLPRQIGQTVSIVGALIIGQAAVTAKVVSPIMVIIVGLTALANFTFPSIEASNAIRLLRFLIIIMAGFLGLFGIIITLLVILVHLCTLRSFGVPFIAPLAPTNLRDLKDLIVRVPWWAMFRRPRLVRPGNSVRQRASQKPGPPPEQDA